jgi:cell fate (sporulation/competence/biofilm development) regulator YlbF (YheA/YmcA/DUF963 family)
MDKRIKPALPDAVRQAAAEFARTIVEATQFQSWENGLAGIKEDKAAADTARKIRELQSRAKSGNLLNLTDASFRKELEKLSEEYRLRPAVASYMEVEGEFREFCQTLNALISDAAGIDFAKQRASGCCG